MDNERNKSGCFCFLFWFGLSVASLFPYYIFPGGKVARPMRYSFYCVGFGFLLGIVLKSCFNDPAYKMVGAGGYSFPSGHSLGGFFFCLLIIFLLEIKDRPDE
jgi:membrane-associated phospholipid phosphatase